MSATERITGKVKWFDPTRGFGFVVSDNGGPDILLHANVLRNFGQNSVADGAEVDITVQITERGTQAIEVHSIEPPANASVGVLEDLQVVDAVDLQAAPLHPARVKWFDKAKGFGFLNVFGYGRDIFVHIEVLRASGLADLLPGEALAVRVLDGKRGLMAGEIRPWEAGLSQGAPEDFETPSLDDDNDKRVARR